MDNLIYAVKNSILQFKFVDAIDIILVAVLVYYLLKITVKTRAIQVIRGLVVLIVMAQVCEFVGFTTITWLLQSIVSAGAVILVVVFQPEIRRALEKIGTGKLFDVSFSENNTDREEAITEMERAILNMSIRKIGALIVFEKKTGIREIIESGTTVDAAISSQLVENIFFPNSPLHDGAMIIRDERITAAGCFLPLSDNKTISSELGTRHRAALGISEISDATVLIVSEETGVISKAYEGTITRYIDRKALRKILEEIFEVGSQRQTIRERIKKK